MGNFLKISGVIVSSLFALFVFIFLIRLKTANTPFISTKAIAVQISTYDMWEPWTDFLDFADDFKETYISEVDKDRELFKDVHWNEPDYVKVNNPLDLAQNIGAWFSALFNVFGQFFNALGNLITSLGKTIGLGFEVAGRFIFAIIKWIGYVIWSLFDFLNFILTA